MKELLDFGDFDPSKDRFPCCIVWSPIPILTWLCPIIGHMGIAMSSGKIRDFAGPYSVNEDYFAFGHATKYWQLDPALAEGGVQGWNKAIFEASEEYRTRIHNICCDNCHSHVAFALNLMNYNGSRQWNMMKLALMAAWYGKYVSWGAYVKTWLPFIIVLAIFIMVLLATGRY